MEHIIIQEQDWLSHKTTRVTKINEQYETIYSYYIDKFPNKHYVMLRGVYVTEKFRGKGYLNEILSEVNKINKNIMIEVNNTYSLLDKYKRVGFVYWGKYDDDFSYYIKRRNCGNKRIL